MGSPMGGGGWRRIARRMKANGRCELCDVDASALSAVASQPDSGLPNADFRQNTRVRVGLKPAVTSPCVNVRTLVAHGEIIRRRYALLDVFRFARDAPAAKVHDLRPSPPADAQARSGSFRKCLQ
eukprot:6182503-Pleurochrysis_carterae.AAC.1